MTRISEYQCPLFYSDIASIFIGLFESSREYKPYDVFVVNTMAEKNKVIIYSSVQCHGGRQISSSKCLEITNTLSVFRLSTLQYMPYVTEYDYDADMLYSAAYFKKFISEQFPNMRSFHASCMETKNTDVFLIILVNRSIKKTPTMLDTLFDIGIVQWRDCFNSGLDPSDDAIALRPINGDANSMIESRSDNIEISSAFNVINSISAKYYERSKSNGTIKITERRDDTAILIEPIPFTVNNARQLRKLLELTRNSYSLLVHDGQVYGIGEGARVEYTFSITGHMEWRMHNGKSDTIELHYKNGNYYIPSSTELEGWYISEKIGSMTLNRRINKLFRAVRQISHGVLLILSENAEKEVDRLCSKQKGLKVKKTIDLIQDAENMNGLTLQMLSSIDGAIFADLDGNCHGFGIILDGAAMCEGSTDRGSRYNSAKNYIYAQKVLFKSQCCAFIQSDDGYVDIFTSQDTKELVETQKITQQIIDVLYSQLNNNENALKPLEELSDIIKNPKESE